MTEMAIPFRLSMKIPVALSKEGFLELCLESLRRNHKAEMKCKKIVVAHFLPWTSPAKFMVDQIAKTEREGDGVAPQGVSSQCQKLEARVQEKNKCKSVSSSLKQLWHLKAIELPLDFAQLSVGVLLWIKRKLMQAIQGLM